MVVWQARRGVARDESVDGFLDGGEGWVFGWELGDAFYGIERDYIYRTPVSDM